MNRTRRWLDRVTLGASALPLGVLFLLFFFDEFDTAAFGVLAPDIEKSFHLTDQRFGLIVVLNLTVVLLLAIPVGVLGDRAPRRSLVVAGGVLAGVFSFLTGMAGAVVFLIGVRIGNGVGNLANSTVHPSLLADYYTPEARARVYSVHRSAPQWGAVFGPMTAGVVALVGGWRAAFMVLLVPIFIATVVALRLTEPTRGGTDDPDSAAEAARERPVPLREGARTLWAVRTLKRQYWAWFFIGAGVIPLAYLLPLYFKRAYGLGPFPRGVIISANGLAAVGGVLMGGRLTQQWFAKEMGEPLRRAGATLAGVGIGLALVAAAPWLPLAIVLGMGTSFVAGMFYPAFYATQSIVSPARVRTLSFGFGNLFLVAGVWALFLIWPMAKVSDHNGIRWGLVVLMPYWLIGGALLASAGRYVAADAAAALRTLGATVELRRERAEAKLSSLLRCVGVDVGYDAVQVLFGVDFDVQVGEIVALLGTNGAGKSTLLKAISGLVDPAGGAILFDGHEITHMDAKERALLGIIQMPGGKSVFPTLTVRESLRLAAWLHRGDPAHVKAATDQALSYFPVLVSRMDTAAGDLSGGEQQMLGLAMALIAKPRLLMIDELSLGLAPSIVSLLVDIVRAIHEQGTTIILVEQSVNVALLLAKRAVFMEKGEVRFSGATAELLAREDILRSVFLEGAAALVGSDAAAHTKPRTNGKAVSFDNAPVHLEVESVVVRYGGVRAVDDVSFRVREGEIVGLIGANGAGKTTLFDAVSGFVRMHRGRIVLDGVDVTDLPAERRAGAGLGRSFQDARIFPSLTVAENIAVALERHIDVRDPVAAAMALPAVADAEEQVALRVHELIDLLGLGAFRNKFVGELSTGSRRIVDLAMAIAHRPSVLLLDEPSSGIAQRETEALGPLIKRIQGELGCSILIIEHDMPLVTSVSDTMYALELGRIIATGTPHEVVNHPQVVASYLGSNEAVVARSGTASSDAGPRRRRRAEPLRAGGVK